MFTCNNKNNISMKKLLLFLSILSFMILSVKGQSVSNYTYLLDNGINIRTAHSWSHVWVQQTYDAIKPGDQASPLAVNIRALGDLISSSAYKLLNAGKEVKLQGAAPGTYDLKLTFKLSGKPGTLSFVIGNIIIKPSTKTSVSVTLYDYQILIAETPATMKGLSSYESNVFSYKGSGEQNENRGVFSFYAKGKHDVKITPDEATSETKGKIKPGTYDVLISIGISLQKQEVWLENFAMKPDVTYKISTNLNGGTVVYSGVMKDAKSLSLYPAGTAAQQTGKATPDKTREIITYENIKLTSACRPGSYDVLINFSGRYEWRKDIVIQTGVRKEVK
jgi:hypothetical protein